MTGVLAMVYAVGAQVVLGERRFVKELVNAAVDCLCWLRWEAPKWLQAAGTAYEYRTLSLPWRLRQSLQKQSGQSLTSQACRSTTQTGLKASEEDWQLWCRTSSRSSGLASRQAEPGRSKEAQICRLSIRIARWK